MASPNSYPGGLLLTGSVFQNGPSTLERGGPVYFSGGVQWVDTIDGDNSNAGTTPERPVATLAQAVTNSSANGAIIIGEGSSETLTGSQAIALGNLSIFGCGTGSSRPRYTCAGSVVMINSAGNGLWLEGLYFPASTAVPTTRVDMASPYNVVKDCYFECGASDTSSAVRMTAASSGGLVTGCSFVTTASRPATGVLISGAGANNTIQDCVFDGGSYGWTNYAFLQSAAATGTTILGGTFSNFSDIGFIVTATSYKIFGPEMTGGSNVRLDA